MKSLPILHLAILLAGAMPAAGATLNLVVPGSSMRYLVPTSGAVDSVWTSPGFDDSLWTDALFNAGFGSAGDGSPLGTNLGPEMQTVALGAYFRAPFQIDDPSKVTSLALSIIADDGFLVSINGTPVGDFNADTSSVWNSPAIGAIGGAGESTPRQVDLSGSLGLLVAGDNILAIHGMNSEFGKRGFPHRTDVLRRGRPGAISARAIDLCYMWRLCSPPPPLDQANEIFARQLFDEALHLEAHQC